MSCSTRLRIIGTAAVVGWLTAAMLLISASRYRDSDTYLDEWSMLVGLAAATATVWYAVMQHASRVTRAFEYGFDLGCTPPRGPQHGLTASRSNAA